MKKRGVVHALAGAGALLALLVAALGPVLVRLDYRHPFARAMWQLPDRVVESLELRPGARVADIGAGDGYFTFRLADAVGPTGRVHAVDVDGDATRTLRRSVAERGLRNVEVVLAEPGDPLLPDGSVDVAFVCNTYHHIEDRVAYFDRLRTDLRPDGRVAILEVRGTLPFRLLTPPGHWTAVETLREEMREAHYRPEGSFDFLPVQSFEIFAVAAGAPSPDARE